MKRFFVTLIPIFGLILSLSAFSMPESPVRIGILNTVGKTKSMGIFSTTLDRLRESLERPIEVSYYDLHTLPEALRAGKLDFFITNAGLFSSALSEARGSHLATLKIREARDPNESMGGIFFVKNTSPHRTFEDIRHQTATAVSDSAFGGYFVPLGELIRRGYEPERFFQSVFFTGYPMQNVFDAVRSGKAQVGMVRACLLEEMIASGKATPDEFRVIEGRRDEKLACVRSTDLYPDWVFAATTRATPEMSRRAAGALLSMPATNGSYWSIATDFRAINDLYRNLKVAHYEYLRHPTLRDTVAKYKTELLVLLLLLTAGVAHYFLVNLEVKRKTKSLREASEAKAKAQAQVLIAQRKLYQLERMSLTGVLANSVAHELKQPISAIANFADGIRELNRQSGVNRSIIDEAVEEILQQTHRAGSVIEHVRGYAKSEPPKCRPLNLLRMVEDVLHEIAALFPRTPLIVNDVSETYVVMADPHEFTLVLLNVLKNAVEALKARDDGKIVIGACREGDMVHVSIEDNGPTKDVSDFCDVYGPKMSQKTDGLGLGLAISARMLERLGGGMTIEAVKPHGVRVEMTLPQCEGKIS